jgi:hypothetical protein
MLHDALKNYLDGVEQTILLQSGFAHVERYVEEILTKERVNLRIRLRSANGHLLEIHEAVVIADDMLIHLDYRYHCQDEQNRLHFCYDSTPHFPDLPNFPHHKHLSNEQVIAVDRPSIEQVVQEAIEKND